MSKKICVFLADGFEEIEGLTVVDLLRRAGAEVTTVSIMGDKRIHGAHKIDVMADELFENMEFDEADMLVLPGGLPGTTYLGEHEGLCRLLQKFYDEERYIAAICAAPRIFGRLGFLEGRKAVSYPTMEEELKGAEVVRKPVVTDGHVITSRGMGTAIDFALRLIEILYGKEASDQMADSIVYQASGRII